MSNNVKSIILMGMLCSGTAQASGMFIGWTRTGYGPPVEPSLKVPGLAGFRAVLSEIDNSGNANKWDRGSSDLSFGSKYAGYADESSLHTSGSTFAIQQTDALRISVTNDCGAGSSIVFNTVLADVTAPFSNSPEILKIVYKQGGLGLAPGTVLGLWTNTPNSGLTGYDDYPDFDADLSAFPVADRTLSNGAYAVFEITVSGGNGASYVDNIAVDGTYNPPPSMAGTIAVSIDPSNRKWTISDRLIGMHCRYDDARDSIYTDGSKAAWAATNHIGFMRYPGGSTTKTYDWQNPSGQIDIDSWDPAYSNSIPVNPPSDWMSLDEYLAFCDAANMIPHVGINWLSGSKFRTLEEGIERASNCVQYVVDAGHPGADYYIGNEDLWELSNLVPGPAGHATAAGIFVQYAQAMKAVDPDIRIFWNDNNVSAATLTTFLTSSNAGDWADGVEFHSKWPYGGDGDESVWNYDDWKTEFPLIDHRRDRTHRDLADTLRTAAAAAGYPDLLMANNEYGIGKNKYIEGFNRYTINLVVIDFLQELFIGNYDFSAFWDNGRQQGKETGEQSLFDPYFGNRFNPSAAGFEMLSSAQGATMLESSSTHSNVYGFAAATDNQILLYLLNKTESEQAIEVSFASSGVDTNQPASGLALIETIGQWGTNEAFAVSYHAASNTFFATLPAMSYNRISFAGAAPPTHEELQSVASGNWTNSATWNLGVVPDYLDRALVKFNHTITVNSPGNEVGSLRLDAGQSFLNLDAGGELTGINSGAFPTNGTVTYKWAATPCTVNVQGGSLTAEGNFVLDGGNTGVTNCLNIGSGTVDLSVFTSIGQNGGGGKAMVAVSGNDATFRVGGNMTLGSDAVMQWMPAADGAVTPIVSDNFKNVTLGGALVVDLSAMTNIPAEIVLIDNNGTDALIGAFASTNINGASGYTLSYTGGDGNDLSLVYGGSAYDQWAMLYSLTNGPSGNDDGDVLNNLYEYGLGGDPTNPADIGILPTFGNSGSVFEYIYPRRTATNSGLTYYLELTDDLVSGVWTNTGYTETDAGTIDADFEAVTNEIPILGKTNEFIRLKISVH